MVDLLSNLVLGRVGQLVEYLWYFHESTLVWDQLFILCKRVEVNVGLGCIVVMQSVQSG